MRPEALLAFLAWYGTVVSAVAAPGPFFAGEAAASACPAGNTACQILAGAAGAGAYGLLKGGLRSVTGSAFRSLLQSGSETTNAWARLLASRAARGMPAEVGEAADALGTTGVRRAPGLATECLRSFGPGTRVTTAAGSVAIATIRPGDTVTARDPATGSVAEHTVANVDVHTDQEIEYLQVSGETIETTPDHRFLTDLGWVEAAALYPGTKVTKLDGTTGTVEGYSIDVRPVTMYDLTVSDVHTFAVGEGQWVVHNVDCPLTAFGNASGPRLPRPEKDIFPDEEGMIGPSYGPYPHGASLTGDPTGAGHLRGVPWTLPGGYNPPFGTGIIRSPTETDLLHHILYPTVRMSVDDFNDLYTSLPWLRGTGGG